MARSLQVIKQQIIDTKNAQSSLSGLNSISTTAIYNLWAYVTATALYFQESLWDLFKTNLEAEIAIAPVGTDSWVSAQVSKFQYNSTNPQIIQLVNFVPSYPVIDPSLQIITRVSVKTLPNRLVAVKVAKQEPPVGLTSSELNSLKGYLDEISFAGVQYNVTSLPADQLMVGATIYYNGQYAAVIQSNVIQAINTYLQSVPFDNWIRLSKLEDAIQSVTGVTDVELNNVAIRADSVPFANTTYMVQNNKEIFYKYPMFSGYAISEQTSPYTLSDTLVFIVEN